MTTVNTVIVGTAFRGAVAVQAVGRLRKGDVLQLRREPQNRHDSNAIAVYFAGLHIGYVPKLVNPRIAPLMDRGEEMTAMVDAPAQLIAGKVRVEPKIVVTQKATAP